MKKVDTLLGAEKLGRMFLGLKRLVLGLTISMQDM